MGEVLAGRSLEQGRAVLIWLSEFGQTLNHPSLSFSFYKNKERDFSFLIFVHPLSACVHYNAYLCSLCTCMCFVHV